MQTQIQISFLILKVILTAHRICAMKACLNFFDDYKVCMDLKLRSLQPCMIMIIQSICKNYYANIYKGKMSVFYTILKYV